jgi:hypothetical protein
MHTVPLRSSMIPMRHSVRRWTQDAIGDPRTHSDGFACSAAAATRRAVARFVVEYLTRNKHSCAL